MQAIVIVSVLAAFLAGLYFLPRVIYRPTPPTREPLEPLRFPPGFLWATGEDAYQHEGGNANADWHDWELESRPFADGSVSGSCVDFWNRWEGDFALAERDGQNAHRIGIEWSRLEPRMGSYDEAAWERYGAMLSSLKSKGFTVFVNLWHFTLPRWAADLGGWESDDVFKRWEAYAAEAARRLGPLVDYWSTMIDAQIYVLRGYFLGEIPPLVKDQGRGLAVYRRLIDAHAAAYRILKKTSLGRARVGQIYFFALYRSAGNLLDSFVFRQLDDIFNWKMLDALYSGKLDLTVALGPSVQAKNERWAGTLDWLGVNYYYREILSFSPSAPGFVRRTPGPGEDKSDLGWEVYPRGVYELGKLLQRRYAGVPLMITEAGLADDVDTRRPRMIVETLAWTHRLLAEGCPIMGFTYWSLTDNLEWTDGFRPKFGLYRVNLETMERIETRSARLFRLIATNGRLPTEGEFARLE